MDIADVVAEWGRWLDRGQSAQDVLSRATNGFHSRQYMTSMITDNNVKEVAYNENGKVWQPFKKTFSPTTNGKVTPREIHLRKMKIDKSFHPDDYEDTWMGFLADLARKDRASWPFIRWYIDNNLVPASLEELDETVWNGVYTAPVENATPGQHLEMFDGLKKQLIDAWNDPESGLNKVTLDPLTTSNIYGEMEKFESQVPANLRRKSRLNFLSEKRRVEALQDKRNTFGYSDNTLDNTIDFRSSRMVGMFNMEADDSDIIYSTVRENIVWITRSGQKWRKFKIEEAKRQVDVLGDYYAAPAFRDMRWVTASIPDAELSGSGSGS